MQGTMPVGAGEEDHAQPDGQHQDVNKTHHGRVNYNDRGQR